MNVITLASRKGGAGKSTLTAHLAACAHAGGYRSLVIDADPPPTLVLVHAPPGIFDLDSAHETIAAACERGKPFAVVLNAAPARREDRDAPALALARAALGADKIPVWSGQISQRAAFAL